MICGDDVSVIIREMRVSVVIFARLMGVSGSTVWRWQTMNDRPLKAEPMQQKMLAALLTDTDRAGLGRAVREADQTGDPLFVFYAALRHIYRDSPFQSLLLMNPSSTSPRPRRPKKAARP